MNLILRDYLIGFVNSALLNTQLLDNRELVRGRLSVLQELDAAFNLDLIRIEMIEGKLHLKTGRSQPND